MQKLKFFYIFICIFIFCGVGYAQPSASDEASDVVVYEKSLEWRSDIGFVTAIEWSPNGEYIAVTSAQGILEIYRANDGEVVYTLQADETPLSTLDWSPDGTHIVTGDDNGNVRLWNVVEGHELCLMTTYGRIAYSTSIIGYGVADVRWSPDGASVASGALDGSLRVWHITPADECPLGPHLTFQVEDSWGVQKVDWSPDGASIMGLTLTDTLSFWHLRAGWSIDHIECPYCRIMYADWSADGRYFFASGENGYAYFAQLWNVGETMWEGQDVLSICDFNPRWMPIRFALVGWCDGEIQVWKADTFEIVGQT